MPNYFDVPRVELQFRLNTVPSAIRIIDPETAKEKEERLRHAANPTGTMVVEPLEKCYLTGLKELEAAGYKLVDAYAQERVDDNVPFGKRKIYYAVRFICDKNPEKPLSILDDLYLSVARNELYCTCETAMYNVKVFVNPAAGNKKIVNISLKSRQPLCHTNGKPIEVWDKDENGIATGKVSLRPKHRLYILDIVG